MGRAKKNRTASVALDTKLIVQVPTQVATVWEGKVGASVARLNDDQLQVRLFKDANAPATWGYNSSRACPEVRIPKGTIEFLDADLRNMQFTYTQPLEVTGHGGDLLLVLPAHLTPPKWLAGRKPPQPAATEPVTPVPVEPTSSAPVEPAVQAVAAEKAPPALYTDPLRYHLQGLKAALAAAPDARAEFRNGELVVYRSFGG